MAEHYADVAGGGFVYLQAEPGRTLTPRRAREVVESFGYVMRTFESVEGEDWKEFLAQRLKAPQG